MSESFLPSHAEVRAQKAPVRLDERLWTRAEQLAEERSAIQARQAQLYAEAERLRSGHLTLHAQEVLAQTEKRYWEEEAKRAQIAAVEDRITTALLGLESGEVDMDEINELLPPEDDEQKGLSRRKQKILAERERTGVDPRNGYVELGGEFVAEPTRLATGRNLRKIVGDYDPLSASDEFFYRTADTHGGKVSFGKRSGGYYKNASGRSVRKI